MYSGTEIFLVRNEINAFCIFGSPCLLRANSCYLVINAVKNINNICRAIIR